ncbi:flagellar basal body P-ring formation chaperone FlgA [Thermosulfidibacter takaii]|uniref:flagellar basal body P-ring formation chaperone FlgA n=1 Tax=Thermosulfidibacter takaii TaxID=412593 RepID=UPI001E5D6B24|nr:flagellar basal body P-ring formation chaperone FlgA [Thermosulfidibacter takaii]
MAFILAILLPVVAWASFNQMATQLLSQRANLPIKIVSIEASTKHFNKDLPCKIVSSRMDFNAGRAWFLVEQKGVYTWVRVTFLVQKAVAVAKTLILRGQKITADKVENVLQWLSPRDARRSLAYSDVINKVAVRNIEAGTVLKTGMLKRPIAVKRGELVKFLLISGGVRIEGVARAMKNAFLGDIVELKNLSSGKIFTGEVVSEGRVVVR